MLQSCLLTARKELESKWAIEVVESLSVIRTLMSCHAVLTVMGLIYFWPKAVHEKVASL